MGGGIGNINLGRSLDLHYGTNLAIALISTLLVLLSFIIKVINGTGFYDAAVGALGLGIGAFVVWALGREVDPDHDISAFIPIGFYIAGHAYFGASSLLAMFVTLTGIRMINNTVGIPFTELDRIVLLTMGIGFAYYLQSPVVAVVAAIAMALDYIAPERNGIQLMFTALGSVSAIVLLYIMDHELLHGNKVIELGISLIVVLTFILLIADYRTTISTGDRTGRSLDATRIRIGQVFFLVAAGVFTFSMGFGWSCPYWSVAAGCSIYHLAMKVTP